MAEIAIDPVCKMEVDIASPAATSEYEGSTYYFCAVGCKLTFDENPGKYLNGASNGGMAAHAPAGAATGAPDAGKKPWWKFW